MEGISTQPSSQAYRNAGVAQPLLDRAAARLGEVEARRAQRRARATRREYVDEMIDRARASRRDDGNGQLARDSGGQGAVESALRAVAIDRGQQNLARAARLGFARPFDGAPAGRRLSAAGEHGEAAVLGFGVDGHDDRLAAI